VARRTAAAHAVSAVLLGGSLGYLAPLDSLIRTANQRTTAAASLRSLTVAAVTRERNMR
jgi:hypothetical protein